METIHGTGYCIKVKRPSRFTLSSYRGYSATVPTEKPIQKTLQTTEKIHFVSLLYNLLFTARHCYESNL